MEVNLPMHDWFRSERHQQQEEALETAESVASRWVVLPNAGWKQKWDT